MICSITSVNTHLITINCTSTKTAVFKEQFTGSDLQAEQRLSDLWNIYGAGLPGRGIKATLHLVGSRKPTQTIH